MYYNAIKKKQYSAFSLIYMRGEKVISPWICMCCLLWICLSISDDTKAWFGLHEPGWDVNDLTTVSHSGIGRNRRNGKGSWTVTPTNCSWGCRKLIHHDFFVLTSKPRWWLLWCSSGGISLTKEWMCEVWLYVWVMRTMSDCMTAIII